ncbi:MAG: Na+ dependent nucleoside transporter domain protein [Acidimicrobiia bacterium]|nr:Na+ dependent nucleoside transporter domain protein [Acidimicrobiia bacterium]
MALGTALVVPLVAYLAVGVIGHRGQAAAGAVSFISLVAACSPDLRRVRWRTVGWGMALQVGLALLILEFEVGGRRPGYELFSAVAGGIRRFLEFTDAGSLFVFGVLADEATLGKVMGPANGFVFAFRALPTIIFVSSVSAVLYHFGVLQVIVRGMARVMIRLMGTSGAETLSAAANVFVGQTEAPLIVKPFVPRMTQSELLAMMAGGMATIAGGVMAVYIAIGADPVAILTTSVMAAPCGLYLSKLLLPELEEPETRGAAPIGIERQHVNAIDAAAGGASDGLMLALNVGAMLIAFLAILAMVDSLLGAVWDGLTLSRVFAVVFAPLAFLMGVPPADVGPVADLLGTKLVANEFVAFVKLTGEYRDVISERGFVLATYALTGFANFASVGVQLGGIGGLAPARRGDLARLGMRALFAGFLTTLVNACVASMLL